MKRTSIKKKSTKSSAKLKAECDAMWAQLVKHRAGGKCEQCNAPGRDAHHMVARRRSAFLRHDLRNGVFLCVGCHSRFHNWESLSLWEWMEESRSEDFQAIRDAMNEVHKVDLKDVHFRLKSQLEVYKEVA